VNNGARSDAIVTFTAPKPAHVFLNLTNGPIIVASVGSPPEALTSSLKLEAITARDLGLLWGPRNYDANKGNFGHVLVIGGSRGKAGAVAMSGIAALRSGAGLCTIACPSGVQALVSGFAPELMTEDLAETDAGTISLRALEYGRIDAAMKGKTVLAIGPGVSRHPEAAEFVRTVVNKAAVPVVLDADGLNAFEETPERLDGSARLLVLTPHPGEMARLTGLSTSEVQADRIGVARKFAREHNCVLVLKGWRTLVAEPGGTVWVNMTGNPGMATGGTGDVLTGIIAGLVAQHPPQALNAVLAAVYLHGLAGDLACTELGEQAMIATDLLRKLPGAFKSVDWNSRVTVLRGAAPQPFWSRNRARRSC
jgi:ADP-dependent NAD(P)H-hydrate dehydratase / NAD(P)H-hydrate epimerase